jgi:hypothetical protein
MFQDLLVAVSNFDDVYHFPLNYQLSPWTSDSLPLDRMAGPIMSTIGHFLFAWMAPIPWLGYVSLFLHCDELTPGLHLDLGPKEAQDGKSAVPRQP